MANSSAIAKDPRVRAGHLPAIPKDNLAFLLQSRGTTVGRFAEALGVGRTTASAWISGRQYMSNRHVVLAAATLGVHPLYILDLLDRADREALEDRYVVRRADEAQRRRACLARALDVLSSESVLTSFLADGRTETGGPVVPAITDDLELVCRAPVAGDSSGSGANGPGAYAALAGGYREVLLGQLMAAAGDLRSLTALARDALLLTLEQADPRWPVRALGLAARLVPTARLS